MQRARKIMYKYILFILIILFFGGCSKNTPQYTYKEFTNINKDSILNAAKRVIFLSDSEFLVHSKRDEVHATKTIAKNKGLTVDINIYEIGFNTIQENNSTVAKLIITHKKDYFDEDKTMVENSSHELFWSRVDYLLGLKNSWPTCAVYRLKLNNDGTFCNFAYNENRLPNRSDMVGDIGFNIKKELVDVSKIKLVDINMSIYDVIQLPLIEVENEVADVAYIDLGDMFDLVSKRKDDNVTIDVNKTNNISIDNNSTVVPVKEESKLVISKELVEKVDINSTVAKEEIIEDIAPDAGEVEIIEPQEAIEKIPVIEPKLEVEEKNNIVEKEDGAVEEKIESQEEIISGTEKQELISPILEEIDTSKPEEIKDIVKKPKIEKIGSVEPKLEEELKVEEGMEVQEIIPNTVPVIVPVVIPAVPVVSSLEVESDNLNRSDLSKSKIKKQSVVKFNRDNYKTFKEAVKNAPKTFYTLRIDIVSKSKSKQFIKRYILDNEYTTIDNKDKVEIIYGLYENKLIAKQYIENLHPKISHKAYPTSLHRLLTKDTKKLMKEREFTKIEEINLETQDIKVVKE